jgi:hypothetical protein
MDCVFLTFTFRFRSFYGMVHWLGIMDVCTGGVLSVYTLVDGECILFSEAILEISS